MQKGLKSIQIISNIIFYEAIGCSYRLTDTVYAGIKKFHEFKLQNLTEMGIIIHSFPGISKFVKFKHKKVDINRYNMSYHSLYSRIPNNFDQFMPKPIIILNYPYLKTQIKCHI